MSALSVCSKTCAWLVLKYTFSLYIHGSLCVVNGVCVYLILPWVRLRLGFAHLTREEQIDHIGSTYADIYPTRTRIVSVNYRCRQAKAEVAVT